MEKTEQLQYGKFYHIYNRGINKTDIFFDKENYGYFLKLYERHIDPVADTYAWCLMKNHFHFLVRIKDENSVKNKKLPHQYFSNLFNAYTKGFNKRYNRQSSLFQRTYKRKVIEDDKYLKKLIIYIHNNPIHHDICEHPEDYLWSSYFTCISNKPTKLKRHEVIELFHDIHNFKHSHILDVDIPDIET